MNSKRSRLRSRLIGGAAVFAASLLFARAHPFGDAGLYSPPHTGAAIMQKADVPPAVRETLTTKCADCHSAVTRAPLYGRFAPFSWLMERDIVEARDAMNLSQWDHYTADEQESFKAKILEETKSHHMPLPQYLLVHWSSQITDADISTLSNWARQSASSATTTTVPFSTEADAIRGKDVFQRRCTGCHALDQDREGPRLRGVFGRTSGAVSGFDYSPAIKQAHITWDETSLERWLTDPDALVPGNNMEFHVAKPQERADLIRYLKESAK